MRCLPLVLLAATLVAGCSGSGSDSDSATPDDSGSSTSPSIDSVDSTVDDPVSEPVSDSSGEEAVSESASDSPSVETDVAADSSGEATEPLATSVVEPDPIPPVAPQSGILTAGDYDDQLNPQRYQNYARNALQNFGANVQAPMLNLDPDERVQLRIEDANGNPQARAHVQIKTNNNNDLNLRTAADGTVWLYPSMDALPTVLDISIQNLSGDVQIQQLIDTAVMDASRSAVITLPAATSPITALDLALVIDTTGSMGDELDYLKAELTDILTALSDANPTVSIRVALVPYRDEGDQYVVRTYPFTNSIAEAQNCSEWRDFCGRR